MRAKLIQVPAVWDSFLLVEVRDDFCSLMLCKRRLKTLNLIHLTDVPNTDEGFSQLGVYLRDQPLSLPSHGYVILQNRRFHGWRCESEFLDIDEFEEHVGYEFQRRFGNQDRELWVLRNKLNRDEHEILSISIACILKEDLEALNSQLEITGLNILGVYGYCNDESNADDELKNASTLSHKEKFIISFSGLRENTLNLLELDQYKDLRDQRDKASVLTMVLGIGGIIFMVLLLFQVWALNLENNLAQAETDVLLGSNKLNEITSLQTRIEREEGLIRSLGEFASDSTPITRILTALEESIPVNSWYTKVDITQTQNHYELQIVAVSDVRDSMSNLIDSYQQVPLFSNPVLEFIELIPNRELTRYPNVVNIPLYRYSILMEGL